MYAKNKTGMTNPLEIIAEASVSLKPLNKICKQATGKTLQHRLVAKYTADRTKHFIKISWHLWFLKTCVLKKKL